MSTVRSALSMTGNGTGGNDASLSGGLASTGGTPSLAASSVLIDQYSINGTTPNFSASAPMLNSVGGVNTVAFSGYVSAIGQYGNDQLTFAVSQGDYTASGATPQTYIQNEFGSSAEFLQPYAVSQAVYYNINLQNSIFTMNAQMLNLTSSASAFSGTFAGVGFYTGTIVSGSPGVFSSLTATGVSTLANPPGAAGDALAGTMTIGSTQPAIEGSLSSIGSGAAVNAAGSVVSHDSGVDGPMAVSAVGHSSAESGSVSPNTSISAHDALIPSVAIVSVGIGASTQHDQGTQSQIAFSVVTNHSQTLAAESLSIKNFTPDPFMNYSHSNFENQQVQGLGVSSQSIGIIQESTKAAIAVGGDSFGFSDHLADGFASHSGQTAETPFDPFNHSQHHVVDAGGHLA